MSLALCDWCSKTQLITCPVRSALWGGIMKTAMERWAFVNHSLLNLRSEICFQETRNLVERIWVQSE